MEGCARLIQPRRLARVRARSRALFRRLPVTLVAASRSFAKDHYHGLVTACARAVVMHFFPLMDRERSGFDGYCQMFGVVLRSCRRPPGSGQHHDIAVICVVMRMTEMTRMKTIQDDVEAGLTRIANKSVGVGALQ